MKDSKGEASGEETKNVTVEKPVGKSAGVAAIKRVPPSIPQSPTLKHGRWSPEEKLLFLHGLKLFGRGRWKKIRAFLPLR